MREASRPVMVGLGVLLWATTAGAWGGGHHVITRLAIDALPADEQRLLAPERSALIEIYCTFPDLNWPNSGEWGGGVGDPQAGRFPDRRREWSVSYYCGWDPVLRVGTHYPHAPPPALEATSTLFARAAEALAAGAYEDGLRSAGAMLHYVQDCASFAHLQPFHRGSDVDDPTSVSLGGYEPVLLASDLAQAPGAAAARVTELVAFTEANLAEFLVGTQMTVERARELAEAGDQAGELAPFAAAQRAARPEQWQTVMRAGCLEASRACADILHTLLTVSGAELPARQPPPVGTNLAHNPSFEKDRGDGTPEGWVVGWLDLEDRVGRAEHYRRGTHWTPHVHTGQRSLLLLWAPPAGLEWRQTWRRALRVAAGERYECAGRVEVAGAGGAAQLGVEFRNTDYRLLSESMTEPLTAGGWPQVSVRATVPEDARWMRALFRSTLTDGAAWLDDLSLVRVAD